MAFFKNCLVLVKKQTHRSTEQNREPNKRHTQVYELFLTKIQKQLNKERIVF